MSWNMDIRQFGNVVEQELDRRVRAVAVKLIAHLVLSSPRDTGTYANNHHASFNALDSRYLIRDKANQHEVISFFGGDQNSLINGYQGAIQSIYVQNNLPYAEYLENGTDRFAAYSIYRNAVAATIADFSRS